ncbi:uncharacterized protein LOC111389673 [Olea europaea var. sylvestris]|uniref:uncharacterized protein LOC111389673 n=1 Tax=Olea europaea var. sylvestris TaxID=158386 RepID=UPI000C1D64E1|nr:uncharacterized protein LOC111389673 [Olea europaea var. sylvestris]
MGIIEDDFVEAIKEFFSSRSILKQINHAIITLVSKLRPISSSIVDQAQATFVEGRSMTKNIHLAQEIMRQFNRKRIAHRCLLKIDLGKAYNSMSWDFLKGVLEGLCFPTKFIQWVMKYVTSSAYSVALNGSIHGFFKGGKGLQQDDPLSPFLFLLYFEYFSRMVKATSNDSEFNYHPKCGPLKITHLPFADDLMFFARGDVMSV